MLREMGATIYVVGVNKKGPINKAELEVRSVVQLFQVPIDQLRIINCSIVKQ